MREQNEKIVNLINDLNKVSQEFLDKSDAYVQDVLEYYGLIHRFLNMKENKDREKEDNTMRRRVSVEYFF
ncbi:unnamed protein product [Paramecium octaurelia]|uniref:Uncharacterized protein n=1 Tax=Paramecium octaurelia TaxID=43137 RepID=A0A8S1YRH0_PAROT|nr:unnamed protein product [Paramecium octaurelia]